MIRFEDDARTRGEQLVLRSILLGYPLAQFDWRSLRAKDFAHDLHGRIFQHACELLNAHVAPDPAAMLASIRNEDCGCGMRDIAEYLAWLVGSDPYFSKDRIEALAAFLDALCNQREAEVQTEAKRRGK
ncbi:DnaB-like helicase N-terminal domain-containing protein [Paraburkholderia acidiphila]|uniref:DNA helicase DnaB-like N-terminal domain-containing protein n=1 Tax=Paraburkholderia acidiphila TaxID=2571747 RepID=A0A7Z2JCN9_9BURK|nr:DnaB-like helicase N-terminal domain-containing protein [Paraburkholderia acidiphila]QGZ59841.1 hypothetical protein FAZ97_33355 [Paraburkholderia acidiphila]